MGLKKKNDVSFEIESSESERRAAVRTYEQLIRDLSSNDIEVRRWAIRDLGASGTADEVFIERLHKETNVTIIEALFSALDKRFSSKTANEMLDLLKSENVQVRNGAIELFQLNPVEFASQIDNIIDDNDPDVRIFCVDIIGAVAHKEATNWLHKIALTDTNINVVGTALDKLTEVGDGTTLEVLPLVAERHAGNSYIEFVINILYQQLGSADE
ncbi:HEAT repeat domain-containing protein [Alteromonas genovensis]|uniref:HEAT repeat domain-containing protein n=1 Tax=Alteromonas genovensis TaxID=471225 RepID=UPI002FE11A56